MTTNDKKEAVDVRRRRFLRTAGLGSVAGAAAVATVAAGGTEALADDGVADTGTGYRETAHVRQTYDLYRF